MEPCSVTLETPRQQVGHIINELTSVDAYMDPFNGIQVQIGWQVRTAVMRGIISSLRTPRGD